ncbi:helix-turn-helix domain-containing protein [Niveispirillum sp. BGYR6]|uniref:helix-turn-helix domain-containing protein n=1 Tax=Niveispirillum sp. BGYR6 TaxID=2971249 RepID=UPI0022B9B8E9|nr:helix-turn-helix domain-containing protein [Niveispirillum sp. BGYR6]MDG5493335.1 helix-turn-helix domain-containing protein [Niveispirillum sp. BGYR6]
MNALHIRPIAETPDSVTLSRADFEAIQELLEDAADLADIEAVARKLDGGEAGTLPDNVVNRLLDGENPVLVLRQHRGLSALALAQAAGLSQSFISEIEAGRKRGGIDTLNRIAAALSVPLDMLVGR